MEKARRNLDLVSYLRRDGWQYEHSLLTGSNCKATRRSLVFGCRRHFEGQFGEKVGASSRFQGRELHFVLFFLFSLNVLERATIAERQSWGSEKREPDTWAEPLEEEEKAFIRYRRPDSSQHP
jgi:hypothetical protein